MPFLERQPMCPLCISSVALYLASGTSAGGLALLTARVLKWKRKTRGTATDAAAPT
jgi:hypothetical protein